MEFVKSNALEFTLARARRAGVGADVRVSEVPAPPDDFFRRSHIEVTIDPVPQGPAWLVIEFHNQGYGLISVEPGVPHSRQWGAARVTSGKARMPRVYWSVLESGQLALPNFDDQPAVVTVPGAGAVTLKPYGLAVK